METLEGCPEMEFWYAGNRNREVSEFAASESRLAFQRSEKASGRIKP